MTLQKRLWERALMAAANGRVRHREERVRNDQTAHGHGGTQTSSGVPHFPPGAKIWIPPPQRGDGGHDVIVIGYRRGTRGWGLARIIMPRRHLTRLRVQGVCSPAISHALSRPLTEPGRDYASQPWQTRQQAEETAALWPRKVATSTA